MTDPYRFWSFKFIIGPYIRVVQMKYPPWVSDQIRPNWHSIGKADRYGNNRAIAYGSNNGSQQP